MLFIVSETGPRERFSRGPMKEQQNRQLLSSPLVYECRNIHKAMGTCRESEHCFRHLTSRKVFEVARRPVELMDWTRSSRNEESWSMSTDSS